MTTRYLTTVGLEVHAQLLTVSKLFCGCSTKFGVAANHNTCPVCLGFPGVLPVTNKKAVECVVKTARALNCTVSRHSRFARKNYYYPDLPKAYQISQYELPIGENGWLDVQAGGETKRIRIHRIHLEEDAGKLIHGDGDVSLVDYNRTSVPLMEIVTEPDIETSEQAWAYLTSLRAILQYIGVCDGNMEEGSMRCEPNISIRPEGQEKLGTKTEIKNLNSIKAVQKGIEFEIARQSDLLASGKKVTQETRGWDDAKQVTFSMRSKEDAHDYRYFPDPDLPPLEICKEWEEEIAATIPELPAEMQKRFVETFGVTEGDAHALTGSRALAIYFEECVKHAGDAKMAANWALTELLGRLNESGQDLAECKISPESLGGLIKLIKDGTISGKIAKTVADEMFQTGDPAEKIIKEKNLVQISDRGAIEAVADEVIAANPDQVAEYRGGKEQTLGWLVGQMMKATKGKANPKLCNEILCEKLKS